MTTRNEIQTKSICSLVIQDIREGVTLRRLIFWSLEHTCLYELQKHYEENSYIHNLDFANSSRTNRVFRILQEVGA